MQMSKLTSLPWTKIHKFLIKCGEVHEPRHFCISIIESLNDLVPYDQAKLYFLEESGKIYDEILFNVNNQWCDDYIQFYTEIENDRFSVNPQVRRTEELKISGNYYSWENYEEDEFVIDYVKPQGLKSSIGFGLCGNDGLLKCVLSLDRIDKSNYTRSDLAIVRVVQPHLNNLHINMYVGKPNDSIRKSQQSLTKREIEIANLLCRGLAPHDIAQELFISPKTVYKHIANMHEKLNVSNRQELLLQLM